MSDHRIVSETAKAVPSLSWRHRRRWWLTVLVVALAAGSWTWVWRHSDQSFDGGYGMKVERRVGEPVWTSLVDPGEPGAEQVTITDLEPRIGINGAAVEIEYVICELDPEALSREGVGGFGYGLHARDLQHYCTRTRPAEGATLPLRSQPPQQLLVGITPTRAGRTVIRSHHMSFREGWQFGSDELDVETRLVAHSASR